MKRLNDSYLRDDILSSFSPDSDIVKWINKYLSNIKENKKMIEERMQNVFPKSFIEVEDSYDDSLTFFVKIYGVERNCYDKDKNYYSNNNNDKAYELLEKIEKEFTIIKNGKISDEILYCLIPSFKNMKTTKQYYPKIYTVLIERFPDMAIPDTNEEIEKEINH